MSILPRALLSVLLGAAAIAAPARDAAAQSGTAPSPCSAPEARQLDFWLGTWDLTWDGGQGTNTITRRFGDCVIEENFFGQMPAGPYHGLSVSVYDARKAKWRQTWVDDRGGFLVFEGGLDRDGIMRLYGEPRPLPDGTKRLTRMSWLNVADDSFDWLWERSDDNGASWELVWEIHYARASGREDR